MFAKNLKYLREKNAMEQIELAKKLDRKSSSSVSEWEKGKYTPKIGVINDIADIFKVSISDLMDKDLSMSVSTTLSLVTDTTAKLNEDRQKNVLGYAGQQLSEQEQIKQQNDTKTTAPILSLSEARARKTVKEAQIPPQQKIPVDLYGILTAGYGSENFDKESTETVYVSSTPARYDLAFRIAGDSMYPAFENDEIVFIKETDYIHNGMIAAFEIDEAAFLKKIYLEEDHIRLVSLNDDVNEHGDRLYPDIYASEDNEIYIIGKVVN